MCSKSTAATLAVALLLAAPGPALADDADDEAAWRADWHRPGWRSAAIAGASFAAGLGIQYGIGAADEPRWTGPILADDEVQALVRARSDAGLRHSRTASDVLVATMIVTPLALEPAFALGYADRDAAARLALVNVQAFSLTFVSTVALKHAVARHRPAGVDCERGETADPGCDERERDTLGFPSGHASSAFAGAGMICLNHEMFQPLGGAWDRAACGVALGAAAATGAFRMAANRHYLSDVVAGALLGVGTGYVLPKWLYVGFGDSAPLLGGASATIVPALGDVRGARLSLTW